MAARRDRGCIFKEVGFVREGKRKRSGNLGPEEHGPLEGCGERRLHHASHHKVSPFP